MKDFLFNAYMSARLCLITPEYYCERWLRAALTITLVLCVSATASAYECPQDPPPARTDTYQGFLGRVHELNGQQLPYRLFVPKGYDATKPYPLVLFLHHAGLAGTDSHNESGWDNCVQLTSEIGSGGYGGVFTHSAVDKDGKRFDTQERYPHFVLAPHANSPAYGFGGGVAGSATAPEHPTRPLLLGILEQVQKEFNIDPGRLYVTGISMGCYGTWDLIMRRPDMFAAASPQSCRGDPNKELLARLKDMPIWSMCGTNDSYFSGAQAMADGMTAIGATEFEFTAMQGVGHSIGNRGYDYPGFIDWMFEQRLAGTQPPGSGGAGGTGGAAGGAGTAGAAGNGGAPNGQAGQAMGGGAAAGGGTSAGAPGSASGGSASGQGGGAAAAPGVTPGGGDDVATTQSGCSVGRASSSSTPLALILALSLGAAAWRPRPVRRRRLGKKVHPLQTL